MLSGFGDDEKEVGQVSLKFRGEIRQGVMNSEPSCYWLSLNP